MKLPKYCRAKMMLNEGVTSISLEERNRLIENGFWLDGSDDFIRTLLEYELKVRDLERMLEDSLKRG